MSSWKQYLLTQPSQESSQPVANVVQITKKDEDFGELVQEKSERLDQLIGKASNKLMDLIRENNEDLKKEIPSVKINVDGNNWDLESFLDQNVGELINFVEDVSKDLQGDITSEASDFDEYNFGIDFDKDTLDTIGTTFDDMADELDTFLN